MRRRRHAPLLCFCLRAVATRRKLVLLPVVARRARSRNAGAPRSPVRNILLILFKDLGTRPSIDHHMLIIPSRYNEWVSVGTGHAGAAVHAHLWNIRRALPPASRPALDAHARLRIRTRVNHATRRTRTDPPGRPSTDPVHAKSQKCARAEKWPADGDYGAPTARRHFSGARRGIPTGSTGPTSSASCALLPEAVWG